MFTVEPGDEKVKFSWTTVDGATGYNLYKSGSADSGFALVSLVSIKTTTFEDTQVENGKTYYYYVKSVDDDGAESIASETKSAMPEDAGNAQLDNMFALIAVVIVIAIIVIIVYVFILIKARR